jgi:hypothetical protein
VSQVKYNPARSIDAGPAPVGGEMRAGWPQAGLGAGRGPKGAAGVKRVFRTVMGVTEAGLPTPGSRRTLARKSPLLIIR